MENHERKGVRAGRDQLLTLINGWDPVGRLQAGGPRDAYESVADKLLTLLEQKASKEEIAKFLDDEILARFGAAAHGSAQFATKALTWFELSASER